MKIDALLRSGLINISELARRLYPNNKAAEQYLDKKIRGVRNLTDKDRKKIEEIFREFI